MADFIMFGVWLALALAVGSFVLSLLWVGLFGVVGLMIAAVDYIRGLFRGRPLEQGKMNDG